MMWNGGLISPFSVKDMNMKNDNSLKVIHPFLTDKFCCIADKCPANCCGGWSVIWTGEEVKRLREICCTGEIAGIASKAFGEEAEYMTMKFDAEGYCPFLRDGLCLIHKDMGEEYLSYTCREYPRIKRLCGDTVLYSCRMTCYSVAESLFNDKNCMDLSVSCKKDLTAIITPAEEASARMILFNSLAPLIWDDNDIFVSVIKAAEKIGIDDNETGNMPDLNMVFSNVFGWEILVGNDTENIIIDDFSYKNIIRALFLEWMINGIVTDHSAADNFCCFAFCAASLKLALKGISELSGSKEQLIFSFCDFVAALTSDRNNFRKIISYLKDNGLNSIMFIKSILN